MSLCWFIYEQLPIEGRGKEFYTLFEERSDITQKCWNLTEDEKKRLAQIEVCLAEISTKSEPPKKWKRNSADSWMGADLCHCESVLDDDLAMSEPYNDHSPETAREYAANLKEALRDWQSRHPGWWKRTDISDETRQEVRTIESAIRYLTRWAERGYCIVASY
jgi:hypothetical protein